MNADLQELRVILEEGVCVTVASDIIANEASIERRVKRRGERYIHHDLSAEHVEERAVNKITRYPLPQHAARRSKRSLGESLSIM